MTNKIEFTRVNNDVNGNPRYVCHFLELITKRDEEQIKQDFAASLDRNPLLKTGFLYDLALERAKKIGGRKFHNKQYGGGIVFQSYNLPTLEADILELMEAEKRPNLAVYDNGGKTLDRYTIVDLDTKRKYFGDFGAVIYDAIGASETGAGFFLHIECSRGRHLGKKIAFSQLSEELQAMVLNEYAQ